MTTPTNRQIIDFILARFNESELKLLVISYFPEVENDWGSGMNKNDKVIELLVYCRRRDLIERLLAALEQERPDLFQKAFPKQPKVKIKPTQYRPEQTVKEKPPQKTDQNTFIHEKTRPEFVRIPEGEGGFIFGEDDPGMFLIGHTIEKGYPYWLDLNKFAKRSSGIFGATETGKSFLTRMILAGLIREDVAAALVFDMHNEYAFDDIDLDNEKVVRGLRTLFGNKVQVAALGKGARVRGKTPDFTLEIALSDFQTGDIELLSNVLNLTDTAGVTLNALSRAFGHDWFPKFMKQEPGAVDIDPESGKTFPAENSVAAWARQNNVHEKAAEALHRKLSLIADRPYVVERPAGDPVSAIVDKLENGRHVILSFGEFDNDLDYLLVSNILTRRIRQHWIRQTEKHKVHGHAAPRPLLIAIEEAHKLLNPALYSQTVFGTIVRELRKYFVTLLVVDHRPSEIHNDIMNTLSTRISSWYGFSDDINAVFTGLAAPSQLRKELTHLKEKEEVMLFGRGVEIPVVIKVRRYDEKFYEDLRTSKHNITGFDDLSLDELNDELFG